METIASAPEQANKIRTAFRMEYSIRANIHAPASRVWSLLTEAGDIARWNSTVVRVDGTIAPGQTIKLVVKIAPKRVFTLHVTEFVPGEKLVLSDGNAMFKGVRTYTLTSRPDGSTDFAMSELFTGMMLPMIAGSLPDFRSEFEQYAADLKREAERRPD